MYWLRFYWEKLSLNIWILYLMSTCCKKKKINNVIFCINYVIPKRFYTVKIPYSNNIIIIKQYCKHYFLTFPYMFDIWYRPSLGDFLVYIYYILLRKTFAYIIYYYNTFGIFSSQTASDRLLCEYSENNKWWL